MAAARLSMIFAPLDCKRPSRDALKVASNWLLDFCSLPSSRNSLPIVVDTFDILSRNRAVSLKLAETVGYWVTRECALRRIPGRVSFDLLIAFAGVNRRHDELLNLLSKNLSSALVLDTFGEIEICALAGAFARLEYLCVTFMSELLRVVEKRFSDGLSWRTYAVILHAFATLRFRPGEENPLMWSGRLSWLKARDYSGILWACGNLEWEVDERIIRRAVKDLCSANRDVTPIDVYSILMAFAYIERRPEEVAEIVEVAVGKRYVPSGMLARQLAAALAGNREVIGLLGLDSLRVALNLLATYENDKKGTESSGAEHEVSKVIESMGCCCWEVLGCVDIGWYSVDIILKQVAECF
ncbi:hypothetical protein FOL47_009678 [Perkinsus chesapeaki]|uniref:Uncharacterized protein n=1 Tax=Perkinsus chesapeaki TaxID=330153 RepID=A0A7J6L716_PERCH|nr:hypothetical protein FOL47_009678 [Perkinsus chesapeaki]